MKCLLLSRYSRLGASSRLRFYQYLPYLEAHGMHVKVASLLGDYYIKDLYAGSCKNWRAILGAYLRRMIQLFKGRRYDLLWIEQELLPWLPAWAESLFTGLGIPYVVDYDDAGFHRYDMHRMMMARALLSRKIDAIMRRAALVIAGNDYLADQGRLAGAKRVEVLPTVIDLNRYRLTAQPERAVFTIGWIGSPATKRYLHLLCPALEQVCRGRTTHLLLVGSGPIELPGVPTEIQDWSEETEVTSIQNFDVGVMPVPDEPWARGKCGYKLIQYMGCARPAVASPVGVNRKIIEENVNGYLARTTEEWVRALTLLRDNPRQREAMGEAGRKKVEAQYCLQVTAPRLLSLLRDAANS